MLVVSPVFGKGASGYIWCTQCERAWSVAIWRANDWRCPTPRCIGTEFNACDWNVTEWPRDLHLEYPEAPEFGGHYSLRGPRKEPLRCKCGAVASVWAQGVGRAGKIREVLCEACQQRLTA